MKRIICAILAGTMLLCALAACAAAPEQDATHTGVLYADFTCGSTETDLQLIQEYPFEYTGERKDAEKLAEELSALTGMDFLITAAPTGDGLRVDWSADSTLIAFLSDREQNDGLFFLSPDSLCWFMMDSLWRTLTDNLDVENIYYTMDGGAELAFEELYPVSVFPSDTPYMGSAYYFAHSDLSGNENESPFARTAGTWRLDGATDTASIEMDGQGGFTAYYASGSVEARGYLDYEDEYGDGFLRYDMYTADGEWFCSFYFDSDTQFHIGNGDVIVYILDE